MTIDELLAVVQAAKDGKTIENNVFEKWEPIDFIGNLKRINYRVKPEPREWTLELRGGKMYWPIPSCPTGDTEYVKVREVLE